jgi:ribonuclease J
MIVATGGQGENRAALARIAFDQHAIKLAEGDLVVFSSKQIPGNELAIGRIQNQLAERGIEMVTERQADIHVSGHPGRPELASMYHWIRPEILVPVHGEMRHMAEQARFGQAQGIRRTIVQQNGTMVRLAPDGPEVVGHAPVGRLVLDGDVILPADGAAMNERRKLAENGLVTVAVVRGARAEPAITIHGLPIEEDREALLAEMRDAVAETIASGERDDAKLREAMRLAVRRRVTAWTGKKPVVDVSIIEA